MCSKSCNTNTYGTHGEIKGNKKCNKRSTTHGEGVIGLIWINNNNIQILLFEFYTFDAIDIY